MAYADKFPTSMKKGGMKKSLPKAQLGKVVKKAVKSAKKLKAAASEKMWPTEHLRRMEDWDLHYRTKSNDKLKIVAGAGFGAAGVAGAIENRKDKKKEAARKKVAPNKKSGGSSGFPDLTGDGKVTRADVLKGRGVFKKGGSIMKTAGKTTTGVTSDYKGYKGPEAKAQVAKVKKAKGKL